MDDAETARTLHQRHGQVGEAAVADRAVSQRVRPFLRRRDHVAEAPPRALQVAGDDHGRGRDQHDRDQVPPRVEAEIGDQRRVGGVGVEDHAPALAIRRRARDLRGAEGAGGAGPVLHHHRNAELRLQMRLGETRDSVEAAAGRERHDEADRGIRPACLRRGDARRGEPRDARAENGATACHHAVSSFVNFWSIWEVR
jgi:hypothetical protein